MKDYVNITKPTEFQIFMRRNGHHIKFAFGILALAIIGSVGVI